MPPRHTYWTIIVDGLPTAFRAAKREELLPTFERLREKHPSARMRWFARGRIWESPEEARLAEHARRTEKRGRDWRPGGQHQDPRDKYDRKKRARNREGRNAGGGAVAPREPWRRDRPPQHPPDSRRGPRDRSARDRAPRASAPPAQERSGNRGREENRRQRSSGDTRPRSGGFTGRDRDRRGGPPRPFEPSSRHTRPPHGRRPDERSRNPERGRSSGAPPFRETMPGRKPDYRSPRPPRTPSDERREKRRQNPPPRPPGPDREPKPGSEPPPRPPAPPDDVITPAPPPERGRSIPGPQGTRLTKRPPPRSRE